MNYRDHSPAPHLAAIGLAGLFMLVVVTALLAETSFNWNAGAGRWEDAAMWGGTVPSGTVEARINGTKEKPGEVVLVDTDALLSHLAIADDANSAASLKLDGPSLTVSGTADVGKDNGSDGRFILKQRKRGGRLAGLCFRRTAGQHRSRRHSRRLEGGARLICDRCECGEHRERRWIHRVGSLLEFTGDETIAGPRPATQVNADGSL